jgi:hypothetical protein
LIIPFAFFKAHIFNHISIMITARNDNVVNVRKLQLSISKPRVVISTPYLTKLLNQSAKSTLPSLGGLLEPYRDLQK